MYTNINFDSVEMHVESIRSRCKFCIIIGYTWRTLLNFGSLDSSWIQEEGETIVDFAQCGLLTLYRRLRPGLPDLL